MARIRPPGYSHPPVHMQDSSGFVAKVRAPHLRRFCNPTMAVREPDAYVAPEIARGEPSPASSAHDVYAVGILLNALIKRERPCVGGIWIGIGIKGGALCDLVEYLIHATQIRASCQARSTQGSLAPDPRCQRAATAYLHFCSASRTDTRTEMH